MKIEQSGPPVGEVVSLDLLKQHCRVRHPDDDELMAHYLSAAVEWVQDACQTVLLATEFTATGAAIDLSFKALPNPEIVSISYVDPLGANGAILEFEIRNEHLFIPDMPQLSSATIVFTAGVGAGNVPVKLVQACLMLAASFYLQRSDLTADLTSSVPHGVSALVAHHRSFAFT